MSTDRAQLLRFLAEHPSHQINQLGGRRPTEGCKGWDERPLLGELMAAGLFETREAAQQAMVGLVADGIVEEELDEYRRDDVVGQRPTVTRRKSYFAGTARLSETN
jgi:hypothetical protein